MNKLLIKKNDIENFSIMTIKDFEGCPDALRFLRLKFKDKVVNLRASKKAIKELIEKDEKGEWIVNFLLNVMKPQYRVMFYHYYLVEALEHIEDDKLKENLLLAFDSFSKKAGKKVMNQVSSKLAIHMSEIESELTIQKEESIRDKLQYEKLVLESVNFFITDEQRQFTRHVTDGLIKLAESKTQRDFVQYNYGSTMKEVALHLMEYTGLW